MIDRMKRGVLWLALLPVFLAIAGLLWTPATSWSAENNAPAGQPGAAPPPIKHPVADPAGCLQCHGPAGPKPLPASHNGRGVETCTMCHKPATDAGQAASGALEATPSQEGEKTAEGSAPKESSQTSTGGENASSNCLTCHGQVGATVKLESGEELSIYVDASALSQSVHGGTLGCTDCHKDKTGYPHNKLEATTVRAYASAGSAICSSCHQSEREAYSQSVHGQMSAAGRTDAASCADCHTAHAVKKGVEISYEFSICAKCHQNVTDSYKSSVHGTLALSGNKDAATCVDCHTTTGTAHGLQSGSDPDAASAPENVAQTCGACHPKALETYSTSFHGKAMRLGVTHSAATCVDCHGAYGVQRVHGPEAPLDDAKVASACAKCHEGADENFAKGWMGHEEASPNWFPAVFFTERFLFFLTTAVVAFGVVHVELDLLRWFTTGRKKKNNKGVKDDNKDS